MGFSDVKEIKETYDYEVANSYLLKGYGLLKILSTRTSSNESDEVRPCYILGKEKQKN